jgi:hypothetical protein
MPKAYRKYLSGSVKKHSPVYVPGKKNLNSSLGGKVTSPGRSTKKSSNNLSKEKSPRPSQSRQTGKKKSLSPKLKKQKKLKKVKQQKLF